MTKNIRVTCNSRYRCSGKSRDGQVRHRAAHEGKINQPIPSSIIVASHINHALIIQHQHHGLHLPASPASSPSFLGALLVALLVGSD